MNTSVILRPTNPENSLAVIPQHLQEYISTSAANAVAIEHASQSLKSLLATIENYMRAMERLAKNGYVEKPGILQQAGKSMSQIGRTKMAMVGVVSGVVIPIPLIGPLVGGIIGYFSPEIVGLFKDRGVYEKLANGGIVKLTKDIQSSVDSVREQHSLLKQSLENMNSRQQVLDQNSEDSIILGAQIHNTEQLILLYEKGIMELIHIAPRSIEHLQSAVNTYQIGDIAKSVMATNEGLRDITNQSVQAAFAISAQVSEKLASGLGRPLITDSALQSIAEATRATQANMARIATNTSPGSVPSPALLALQETTSQVTSPPQIPNNPT